MKLKKPLNIKIKGLACDIEDYIRDQENYYIIVRTSQIIKHPEDENSHAFFTIVQEAR